MSGEYYFIKIFEYIRIVARLLNLEVLLQQIEKILQNLVLEQYKKFIQRNTSARDH